MPDETKTSATLAATPFCRELRSKKYFTLRSIPLNETDLLDASGHCWCRQTMQVVGPDGEMVETASCKPGRSCYRSHWEQTS
jgi:hypothetical protein